MFRKLLSLLGDSLVFGVATALSQLINFLLVPLLTRYLGPADYGILDMLNIFMGLYVPVANIGMSNAIFRRFNVSKDESARRDVLSTGLVSVVGSTAAFGAICFLASPLLAQHLLHDPQLIGLVWLTILSAMLHSVQNIGLVTLRADRHVKTVAQISIFKVLSTILPTVFFVTVMHLGVAGSVYGTLVGSIASTVATFVATRSRFGLTMSRATWGAMFSYGLPFVFHHLMGVLLGVFGQIVVNQWLGARETGLYGMALKFSLPFAFIVNSVQKAWVPFKFQIHADDADPMGTFRGIVTYYLAGSTYLWLGVSLWGPLLLVLMTAPSYHTAAALVPITAIIPLCEGMYFMLGTGIELGDNTRAMPLVTLSGLATVMVGSLVLVPSFLGAGAACASALSWLVMATIIYLLSQRQFPIKYDWPVIGSLLLVSSALILFNAWLSSGLGLIERSALALVLSLAYPAIVALILLRSEHERHRVRILFDKLTKQRAGRGKKQKPNAEPEAESTREPEAGSSAERTEAASENAAASAGAAEPVSTTIPE
ncbi:MAG: oligosaccharide flippase family protein [Pirellulales bacterium]|nr:oligosaccharide flippase family protein [Pirellulales bacterium]